MIMDLSPGSLGDAAPHEAETVWDYFGIGMEYTISFISKLWLYATWILHRTTRVDIFSVSFIKELLEHLIVYLYLIVCAFCASARDCLEVVHEYFSENSLVWMESVLLLILVFLVISTLTYLSQLRALTMKSRKRVLIAIAHPVDNVLYFGPTILKLKDCCDVKILCFSSGNGLPEYMQQKNDLYRSCEALGISASNITLMRNTVMPADESKLWDVTITSRMLLDYIECYSIDEVYTFDIYGVSGNANHSSLFYAAARLSLNEQIPEYCKIYTMETINAVRKYIGFFDALLSSMPLCHRRFLISFHQAFITKKTMKLHQLQPSWFRKYFIFSYRYMYINTYREIDNDDLYLQLNDYHHL